MTSSSTMFSEACTRELPCDLRAPPDICQQARELLARAGLPADEIDAWELALAEATNNAVKHCRPEALNLAIRVDFLVAREWVEIRVTDHTPGFVWPEKAELPPDDSESGRGLFLIQSLTDEAYYLRGRKENCLVLRRRRPPAGIFQARPRPGAAQELQETRHTLDLMTEELASCYEILSAIFSFTTRLPGDVSSVEFMQRSLNQLLTITESDWFVLYLCARETRELRLVATSDLDWQKSPGVDPATATVGMLSLAARAVAQSRDLEFDVNSPLSPNDSLHSLAGPGCGFAHPLRVDSVPVGVLVLGRRDGARSYKSPQVSVVQTIGDFIGLLVRNTQMQEDQVIARLNTQELQIAAKIQRTLLPDQLPSVPRAVLEGFYRSAREVGGDYYDALPLGDGNVLLIVADVMGKGLPAALFAFMFRSLVRSQRHLASQPGRLLAWLNQNLFEELDRSEMFITAQLAFLDCRKGEVRVSSAGHPPMLLASSTGEVRELSAGGPPLGTLATAAFPEETHTYWGGCALMFTDGLIEARNLQGEWLGLAAVKAALACAARTGESCASTRNRLASQLQQFEQNTPPADDTAFIVITGRETNENG